MLIVGFVAIAFGHQLEGGFGGDREGAGPAFVGADADRAFDRLGGLLGGGTDGAHRDGTGAEQRGHLGQLAARIAAVQKLLFKLRWRGRFHDP